MTLLAKEADHFVDNALGRYRILDGRKRKGDFIRADAYGTDLRDMESEADQTDLIEIINALLRRSRNDSDTTLEDLGKIVVDCFTAVPARV